MMDADLKEITACFNASPAQASVDTARLWRAVQSIRREEQEACANIAKTTAESWGKHPSLRETDRIIAQQVAVLIEAAILQRGEK